VHIKISLAFGMLLISASIFIASSTGAEVEAITAVNLPVDSVTIYPDGLVAVKRMGSMEVTEGGHKFVIDVPGSADRDSILLRVTNTSIERVVYEGSPVYTLNVSSAGSQEFLLSYLMYNSGYWEPLYDLHLGDSSMMVSAFARVTNSGEEDLEDVRLKLVAGLEPEVEPYLAKTAVVSRLQMAFADEARLEAAPAEPAPATGELETLYIFELEGRKDLDMDKETGLPLFEEVVPLKRVYIWDAYLKESGPADEEIRANNTLLSPWPSGKALLYRDDEYVSTITMPYTPAGTNASINVGPSADLKVERKLQDYNISERIMQIASENRTGMIKETTETWSYHLAIESNLDRNASLEVNDIRPKEAKMISASPEPSEATATSMKWKLSLEPREKTAIDYVYQVVSTEPMEISK
jgi:hypothetical protein